MTFINDFGFFGGIKGLEMRRNRNETRKRRERFLVIYFFLLRYKGQFPKP